MDWDLYLDESGNFTKYQKCLVGGMLVPRGALTPQMLQDWKEQIQQTADIAELIRFGGGWIYDHCRENKENYESTEKIKIRFQIQLRILEEYHQRLQKLGGRIVIFHNPAGVYNLDNTTNYLTVLAKGYMMLYYRLRDEQPVIWLHPALRKNVTRTDEPKQLAISPTRVQGEGKSDRNVIIESQYIAQIKNMAFLHAGQRLLTDRSFRIGIDSLELLYDQIVRDPATGIPEKTPNPYTVPCDYICNTWYNLDNYETEDQERLRTICQEPSGISFDTSHPLQSNLLKMGDWQQTGDNGPGLIQLISMGFPEPAATEYLSHFNEAPFLIQKTAITNAIEGIRPHVMSQQNMEALAERLTEAVSFAGKMENQEIRNEYSANLLLYQQSLYTHLGNQNQVRQITNSFNNAVELLQDTSVADNLYFMADNRQLVNLTDNFDFDNALRLYEEIESEWNHRMNARRRRNPAVSCYPEYGKMTGSFLQTLRHMIHRAEGDDKLLYYEEAAARYEAGLMNLLPNEQARFHQTVCDIESEVGNVEAALEHLYLAASKAETLDNMPANPTELAKVTLDVCGYEGEKDPYLMQHFVRLLSQVFLADPACPTGEALIIPLIPSLSNTFGNKVNNLHPRTQMQWKFASALATREKSTLHQKNMAVSLFTTAAETLLAAQQAVFSAIAVGILAEQLWHTLAGRLPGNPDRINQKMQGALRTFLNQKTAECINPFDERLLNVTKNELSTSEKLFRTAFMQIGY